jgi:long-chain acyl-CoA synthetase
MGEIHPKERITPNPDTVLSICYHSRHNGCQRGILITHRNVVSAGGGFVKSMPRNFAFTSNDRHVIILPLSNMFERIVLHSLIHFGCQFAFHNDDKENLFDALCNMNPTFITCNPELLSMLCDRVQTNVRNSSLPLRYLFQYGFSRKQEFLKRGVVSKSSIWDRIIRGVISKPSTFGSNLRLIVSTSDPVSPALLEFTRACFGCHVIESFGPAESCSVGLLTQIGDHYPMFGPNVGIPFYSCEYKLIDVPSSKYFSDDVPNPRGEVCICGPVVMK